MDHTNSVTVIQYTTIDGNTTEAIITIPGSPPPPAEPVLCYCDYPSPDPNAYIPSATIHDLPFDLMYLIFKRFKMECIFPFRLVCHSWNATVLQMCTVPKHLNLRLCAEEEMATEYESELIHCTDSLVKRMQTNQEDGMTLRVNPALLNQPAVTFLLVTFQSLQSLSVQYNGNLPEDGITPLAILLLHLPVHCRAIKSFTFWYVAKGNGLMEHQTNFVTLFNYINTMVPYMKALEELRIYADGHEFSQVMREWGQRVSFLAVLPQLHSFALNVYAANLGEVIRGLDGNKLTHLSLDCDHFDSPAHIQRLFENVNPGLTRSVTHLRLNHPKDPSHLAVLCNLFAPSLQQLTISFYSGDEGRNWFTILNTPTMEAFSRMSKLTDLTLFNCLLNPNVDMSYPRVKKLALSVCGKFMPNYLKLIQENLDRDRILVESRESARELAAILVDKHFPMLRKLTFAHTHEYTGDLLRAIMAVHYPHIETYCGGPEVRALKRSHYRRLPKHRAYSTVQKMRPTQFGYRNVPTGTCDIDSPDYYSLLFTTERARSPERVPNPDPFIRNPELLPIFIIED